MGAFDPRQLREDARGTISDERYVSSLEKKWSPLLEGVPNRTPAEKYTRGVMAVLMENESAHLRGLNEETRQINVGPFTKFVFPVLRRVFPTLIANEIVSVQPMTAPIGAIFYLDYIYGTNKGGTNAGNTFPKDFDKDYSSEYVNGEALVTGDGVNFGGGGTALSASLGFKPVRPLDSTKGYSVVIKEIHAVTGAVVQTATDNGTGGFTGAGTGVINYSNGALSGFKFTNAPALNNLVKVFYYYDSEFNAQLPQVGLDVKKAPVEAVTRKLKALWSAEAAEDLKNLHGIEAETEIISITAQEIALEIDREIINDLFQSSTGTSGTFDRIPPAAISELDHLRSMITTFSTVSNQIHKKTLRAPANFIVTSPEISALLSQLTTHGDFRPLWSGNGGIASTPADAPMPLTQHGQFGIYKVGTLMNKWMVYEDPFFTRDMALVGLKGNSYLDSGYVWAPYIPLQITPTFLDPNDFTFRKGMRTRYAKKLVRSEFYGQVRILNV